MASTSIGTNTTCASPFFETGAERYLWLNHIVSVGIGERRSNGADYEIFQIL